MGNGENVSPCSVADSDTPFSQEILYIAVAQLESVVEPDSIGNDIWRETVAFISNDLPLP